MPYLWDYKLHSGHCLCLMDLNGTGYSVLCNKIKELVEGNSLVLYTHYAPHSAIVKKMVKNGFNPQKYIVSGSLKVITNHPIRISRYIRINRDSAADEWFKTLAKYHKGTFNSTIVINIFSSDTLSLNELNTSLVSLETAISERISKKLEVLCCYDIKLASSLPIDSRIQILKSHYYTLHTGWQRQSWLTSDIVKLLIRGIDEVLGTGSANLLLKTLKLVYKLDDRLIVEKSDLFESTLRRIMGDSAEVVLNSISKEMINEMLFEKSFHSG